MAITRSVLTMSVLPGREAAYIDWLRGCPALLGPIYARTGVREKVVLISGQDLVVHYEADRPESVMEAFADPIAVAEMGGPLSTLLDSAVPPGFYSSELAWDGNSPDAQTHCALKLSIKPGQEESYLHWVHHGAVPQFEALWKRFGLARKEVLVSGRALVAFYRCIDSASVLATFGEPESIAAMSSNLGPLLEIDATKPMQVFEQVFVWRAGD